MAILRNAIPQTALCRGPQSNFAIRTIFSKMEAHLYCKRLFSPTRKARIPSSASHKTSRVTGIAISLTLSRSINRIRPPPIRQACLPAEAASLDLSQACPTLYFLAVSPAMRFHSAPSCRKIQDKVGAGQLGDWLNLRLELFRASLLQHTVANQVRIQRQILRVIVFEKALTLVQNPMSLSCSSRLKWKLSVEQGLYFRDSHEKCRTLKEPWITNWGTVTISHLSNLSCTNKIAICTYNLHCRSNCVKFLHARQRLQRLMLWEFETFGPILWSGGHGCGTHIKAKDHWRSQC